MFANRVGTPRVTRVVQTAGIVGILAIIACSSATPLPAQVGAAAELTTTSTNTSCNSVAGANAAWLAIGLSSAGVITSTNSNGTNGVTTSCSVTPTGNGFDVVATVSVAGKSSNSVTVSGFFAPAPGTGSSFTTTFGSAFNTFNDSSCTATYPTNLTSPDPASGRIWVDISCGNLVDSSSGSVCAGTAQLRFENCLPQ